MRITSRTNPRVKSATTLRERRERLRQGRFLIDGAREIRRALAAGVQAIEAFVCPELVTSDEASILARELERSAVEHFEVAESVYSKLQFGDRDDGIVVVATTPRRILEDLRIPSSPLVAVLEGVEKPGNVGAILRSADAAGVDAVLLAGCGSDLFNPNTIRASIGTVFRDNVCETTTAETLVWLRNYGLPIFAARPDATIDYTTADFHGPTAIVLGSEAHGLSDAWTGGDITPVKLPMHGLADSLNVSVTAAVLFYEARRQRAAK